MANSLSRWQMLNRDNECTCSRIKWRIQATVKSASQIINKAGKHKLRIWMVDPGVMIDRVLIDLGGWKDSYAFPAETKM